MRVVLTWSSLAFCSEIHDAAMSGDLAKVKSLLKGNPVLVFSKDNVLDRSRHRAFGRTPLWWAASKGHKDVAGWLLANGVDVNAKDNDGDTPLHGAAIVGRNDMAALLLANKAKVNANDSRGYTPLHWAY